MQIGAVIQKSWEIFKANPSKLILPYFVIVLISIGMGIVLGFIPFIGPLIGSVVGSMFWAGLYYAYLKLYRGEETVIDDVFYPIKESLVPLGIMELIKTVFISIGFILLIVPGIYLAVSYIFAELLIVDKKLDAWEALETSRKTVTKNWFEYFALLVVLMFINIIGLIPLGLGLVITVPISSMSIVSAYVSEFYGEAKGNEQPNTPVN
ncbi:MAG: hypothetical protein GWP10_22450 [Nitrospiraceae bacterium]|nr:hypothetical protein [Nitrospiraceae bacterium]